MSLGHSHEAQGVVFRGDLGLPSKIREIKKIFSAIGGGLKLEAKPIAIRPLLANGNILQLLIARLSDIAALNDHIFVFVGFLVFF